VNLGCYSVVLSVVEANAVVIKIDTYLYPATRLRLAAFTRLFPDEIRNRKQGRYAMIVIPPRDNKDGSVDTELDYDVKHTSISTLQA
jgi:hypothetical protein